MREYYLIILFSKILNGNKREKARTINFKSENKKDGENFQPNGRDWILEARDDSSR